MKITIIAVFPLILLSWIRSFQELTLFTIAGMIALIASLCIILIDGYRNTTDQSVGSTPLFLPLRSSLNFLGPATFCYTIHYCVLAIGAEGLICVRNENISYLPHTSHMIISPLILQKYSRIELIIDDDNDGNTDNTDNDDNTNDNSNDNIPSNINCNSNEYNDKSDSIRNSRDEIINVRQTVDTKEKIIIKINDDNRKNEKNDKKGHEKNGNEKSRKHENNGRIERIEKEEKEERNERAEKAERIEKSERMKRNETDYRNEEEALTFDYNPKREILTVITDISGPLRVSFALTCALNILLGGAGFSFYRNATTIR